jgi:D-alanyl-lipoteichoic acid acyltransferase DltB (MBOAT superfamily)
MIFNSLTFVLFFAVVLLLHNLPFPWRVKKFNLLLASYVFYGAWNPPFVALLWISTVLDWYCARFLYRESRPARRRLWLGLSLAGNLGMLGYFKYGEFLLQNWTALVARVGIHYVPPEWDIVLPVGISFYTFQTMAYTLDVYLRRARPATSFLDYALFVTFFPQLVAGPIVRPTDLVPQFAEPRQPSAPQFLWGLALMTLGLFQKTVIADGALSPAADAVYGFKQAPRPLDAWLGTLAFSGQIFSDFAGYSTTAIGCSLCLGFSLTDNFRYPYAAIGFSDFWRRWHISLSTWLRDYLYIPLGGNQRGRGRTYINLMITMLLGGLWHGASWTFVTWGGLHGLYLAVERWLKERFYYLKLHERTAFKIAAAVLTYALVNVTWVFFRADSFPVAWRMLRSMVGANAGMKAVLPTVHIVQTVAVIGAILVAHWTMRERRLEAVVARMPWWLIGAVWGAMAFLIIITQDEGHAFIYFQF